MRRNNDFCTRVTANMILWLPLSHAKSIEDRHRAISNTNRYIMTIMGWGK